MAMNLSLSPGRVLLTAHVRPTLRQRWFATIREWRRRARSRRELAALSQLELKDIGYPPATEKEKYKPFWEA